LPQHLQKTAAAAAAAAAASRTKTFQNQF